MKFREITLESGTKILLGKNAENNDELMKKFKDKENIIFHTVAPGSPFCVIDNLKPSKEDINLSATYCARYSQDWRDNKGNVNVSMFTGKDISKEKGMKPGMWKVKKSKTIRIKKKEIEKLIEK
ncbi:MAG TPA: NFACT RNA binding domain-containing protein [Patescibacteria group bacterium]|nr:NFACT RNA binding domain-containing protein [Patescibacteria group bacterium]